MRKLIVIFIFLFASIPPVFADHFSQKSYTVEVPAVYSINAIGVVPDYQEYGLPNVNPSAEDLSFLRLVAGTYSNSESFWELTTIKPIGVSISYNSSYRIDAEVEPLRGQGSIGNLNSIRVYPSTVAFSVGSGAGVIERIFKFYPIVRVSKHTYPGTYVSKIIFTVSQL